MAPDITPRTIAVVGASGRTGQRVAHLLEGDGHRVVPISRTAPDGLVAAHRPVDVLDPAAVMAALDGVDGAVVALGISENPLAVRLRGARRTADDIRSRGTRHVIDALRAGGGRRLVVLSSYGVGDSHASLPLSMRLVIDGLLAPQFRDHAEQERIVRASGLDWTIARPVNLVEGDRPGVLVDPSMRTVSMKVSVDQVAQRLAAWAVGTELTGRAAALSS